MFSKDVLISNNEGLRAKLAVVFIQKANEFSSSITLSRDEVQANAKSLLGILSLGIKRGVTVTVTADGVDEEEAVDMLVHLLAENMSE